MRLLLALAVMTTASTLCAETLYISDKLTVPLRSGPSNAHRILHRGLPSGTALEVLSKDQEAGFTEIRTGRGTEGWIRTQYLVDTPIAAMRLVDAERRVARLERELKSQNSRSSELSTERDQSQRSNAELTRRVKSLEQELSEIKRVSAGAIEAHSKNQKLGQLNSRLRSEIDDLVQERGLLQENTQRQWMLIGAGLVGLGLLLGILLKARPRRSGWS